MHNTSYKQETIQIQQQKNRSHSVYNCILPNTNNKTSKTHTESHFSRQKPLKRIAKHDTFQHFEFDFPKNANLELAFRTLKS